MAFNIHEEYWDRPLSGNSQDNRIPHGIAVFLSGLFSLLCKVLFRFRVEGKEIVDDFAGRRPALFWFRLTIRTSTLLSCSFRFVQRVGAPDRPRFPVSCGQGILGHGYFERRRFPY